FRRIFKGPPSLKLIQLLYYITQDIKCIILDNKK
ncbi:damage-inducible protein CinA, partial [Acinetobacter pittii]|nr:damage-inducible protein CinA [Acinetobacter pittii]MBJ9778116.1 damage-inducible protein CinA [Acinetobacter pittii]MDX8205446.1 damage-inducible protein CinA [Acinetobacter pittii]MDX8231275.1 damage-inducible protein CinA [Acinetobacter pittii]